MMAATNKTVSGHREKKKQPPDFWIALICYKMVSLLDMTLKVSHIRFMIELLQIFYGRTKLSREKLEFARECLAKRPGRFAFRRMNGEFPIRKKPRKDEEIKEAVSHIFCMCKGRIIGKENDIVNLIALGFVNELSQDAQYMIQSYLDHLFVDANNRGVIDTTYRYLSGEFETQEERSERLIPVYEKESVRKVAYPKKISVRLSETINGWYTACVRTESEFEDDEIQNTDEADISVGPRPWEEICVGKHRWRVGKAWPKFNPKMYFHKSTGILSPVIPLDREEVHWGDIVPVDSPVAVGPDCTPVDLLELKNGKIASGLEGYLDHLIDCEWPSPIEKDRTWMTQLDEWLEVLDPKVAIPDWKGEIFEQHSQSIFLLVNGRVMKVKPSVQVRCNKNGKPLFIGSARVPSLEPIFLIGTNNFEKVLAINDPNVCTCALFGIAVEMCRYHRKAKMVDRKLTELCSDNMTTFLSEYRQRFPDAPPLKTELLREELYSWWYQYSPEMCEKRGWRVDSIHDNDLVDSRTYLAENLARKKNLICWNERKMCPTTPFPSSS